MRELVFSYELRGRGEPVEGRPDTVRVRSGGRGPAGETVAFESRVVLQGDSLDETGTIRYGARGGIRFDTLGTGHIGPSPVAGLQMGAVAWRVLEGDGEFAGASGIIVSNFTVSAEGEVVDDQYTRMFIP